MSSVILIVEDDMDVQQSLQELLEETGYSVLCACNGQEAIDLLSVTDTPSLIVLDLLMPVMDGVEFLKIIQHRRALAAIPVLVVSAASSVKPPPGVPVLQKPFVLATFIDAVKKLCRVEASAP
jgi:CheY-like chemotaxis protein